MLLPPHGPAPPHALRGALGAEYSVDSRPRLQGCWKSVPTSAMLVGLLMSTTLTTPVSADAMKARATPVSYAMFSAASVSHSPVW